MQLESWARSEIGLVRKSNQDAIGVYPELGVFILADGMGGHAAGEVASRMAVDAIRDSLQRAGLDDTRSPSLATRMARLVGRSPVPTDLPAALRAALEHTNRIIVEAGAKGTSEPSGRSMGSTAVVLVIAANDARASFGHVGDSRLYRFRGGELTLLTADHTVPGDPYQGAAVIPTDLPHTNVLLQALGTEPDVDVAVGTVTIDPNDLFLLCSDGVSGMIGAELISDCLRNAPTLEAAGQALLSGALDAGGRDNASLILVRLLGD